MGACPVCAGGDERGLVGGVSGMGKTEQSRNLLVMERRGKKG